MDTQQQTESFLEIIGFRTDADNEGADFFTIVLDDARGNETPVNLDGQLIFFSKIELASKVLCMSSDQLFSGKSLPVEECLICDLNGFLYYIENEDVDEEANILNCLNVIFDIIECTEYEIPVFYKDVLFKLADHLTFDSSLKAFFNGDSLVVSQVRDGFMWMCGCMLGTARFIHE